MEAAAGRHVAGAGDVIAQRMGPALAEWIGNGDGGYRAVLNLLAHLQEENETSYLFISHDLAVVSYLADYIAVMYLGELFEVGYAKDLFHPPLHPYTEALVSA